MDRDGCDDESSADPILLEVAANPLNSLNPPPPDLPDLLDSLISSDAVLQNKLRHCRGAAEEISSRVEDVQTRLRTLRSKFPRYSSDNPYRIEELNNKTYIAFKLQERIYDRMLKQVAFLFHVAHEQLPETIQNLRIQHQHIFNEFLGRQHNHPGIEIANSDHLHCVDGCGWYFEHGPFEFSKKPYSNEWWADMNQTVWDWVKLREHIEELIKTASQSVNEVDLFIEQLRKQVPKWFWAGGTHKWSLTTNFRKGQDADGITRIQVNGLALYPKTEKEMEEEHSQKLQVLVQKLQAEGRPVDQESIAAKQIVIDPTGNAFINDQFVFDGKLEVVDWNKARNVSKGSWLAHWGYIEWLTDFLANQYRDEERSG